MMTRRELRAKYSSLEPCAELEQRLDFEVWSASTDPHRQGLIQVRVYPSKLAIRWRGEEEWRDLEWDDLALLSGSLTQLVKDNIESERERGYNEGMAVSQNLDTEEMRAARLPLRIVSA